MNDKTTKAVKALTHHYNAQVAYANLRVVDSHPLPAKKAKVISQALTDALIVRTNARSKADAALKRCSPLERSLALSQAQPVL